MERGEKDVAISINIKHKNANANLVLDYIHSNCNNKTTNYITSKI